MNRPNYHMRYRRSVYRKKRIKMAIITSVISLAVIALLFVIIGNAVGNKVEENVTRRRNTSAEAQQSEHAQVRSVKAFPVTLFDESSTLASRLKIATDGGYGEICFDLDSPDGTLLYSSDVSLALGKQAANPELWSLPDAVKQFESRELYSIGITHLAEMSSDDDLLRASASGYYASLIAEALRSGVDEVLIHAGDVPRERYGELILLANEVHRLCPEGGFVGISLPVGILSDAEASELIDGLWGAFDYLAADLTGVGADGQSVPDAVSSSLGGMLYYLLRYNVRVLVPYSDDQNVLAATVDAVFASGSQNVQIMY